MSAFTDFLEAVKDGAGDLAQQLFETGVNQARADAQAFVESTKEKVERWAKLAAQGELTKAEFAFLIKSQRDLAELHALTTLGLELLALQRFRDKLIDLVIDSAFDILL